MACMGRVGRRRPQPWRPQRERRARRGRGRRSRHVRDRPGRPRRAAWVREGARPRPGRRCRVPRRARGAAHGRDRRTSASHGRGPRTRLRPDQRSRRQPCVLLGTPWRRFPVAHDATSTPLHRPGPPAPSQEHTFGLHVTSSTVDTTANDQGLTIAKGTLLDLNRAPDRPVGRGARPDQGPSRSDGLRGSQQVRWRACPSHPTAASAPSTHRRQHHRCDTELRCPHRVVVVTAPHRADRRSRGIRRAPSGHCACPRRDRRAGWREPPGCQPDGDHRERNAQPQHSGRARRAPEMHRGIIGTTNAQCHARRPLSLSWPSRGARLLAGHQSASESSSVAVPPGRRSRMD